jgi:hypothetical protein
VASTSEKQAFHVFNKKDHYKDWQFIYDPTSDRGGLIRGPYNGIPAFGGGTVPGAVTPSQMQAGSAGSSGFGQQSSPLQNQPASPFGSQQSSPPGNGGSPSTSGP